MLPDERVFGPKRIVCGMADPDDSEIEARLASAPVAAWAALSAAAASLAAEAAPHGTWAGGEVVEVTVVEGVERPVRQVPYVVRGAALTEVHAAVAGVGAIVPFDWPAWQGLVRHPTAASLVGASVADAVRVLTTAIRGDRFNEGLLLSVADDGRLLAALDVLLRWWAGRGKN